MKPIFAHLMAEYEAEFRLPPAFRRKLVAILTRATAAETFSGLTVLALRAFPSSPLQQFIQKLREESK